MFKRPIWNEDAEASAKGKGKTPAYVAADSHPLSEPIRASQTHRLQRHNFDSSSESGSELDSHVFGSVARHFDGGKGENGGAEKESTNVLPARGADYQKNKVCAQEAARTCGYVINMILFHSLPMALSQIPDS